MRRPFYVDLMAGVALAAGACRPADGGVAQREMSCDSAQWSAERVFGRRDVRERLGQASFPDSAARWVRLPGDAGAVVGVGWQAPRAGALLLFGCDGRLRASTDAGAVDTMWLAPFSPSLPPMVAVMNSGQATSYQDTVLTLYAVEDTAIRRVYAGKTYVLSAATETESVQRMRVRFEDDAVIEESTEQGTRRLRWNDRTRTFD